MNNFFIPNMVWEPLQDPEKRFDCDALMVRMREVFASWEGSHYESGASVRGVACDCIGGVFGVLNDLDGLSRETSSPLPHDAAMHNREEAISTMRKLVRRAEPVKQLETQEDGNFHVQPGDIVVIGFVGGGPGHVAIVGPERSTLWHSLPNSGWHFGGFGLDADSQSLWGIYRISNRERWAR